MEFKEISQNIYACLQEDSGFGYNNSGYINLGDGVVIDTHYDLKHTQQQKDFIKSVSSRSPKYLVNTHHNRIGKHCC